MPGGRRKVTTEETLDQKIEQAQQKVIRTKASYDKAVEELQKLLDKRDAHRKDEIWNAIIKSKKSYEEILKLISGDSSNDIE